MTDLALEQAFSIGMGEEAERFPTPLDRLIHLRTLPSLGSLAGPGLAYIATHAQERHFEAGEVVYSLDEPVTSVHFIVEGNVRVEQDGVFLLDGKPPFAIGFFPVLSSADVAQHAVATEPTVTLEVSSTDLLEIFEDDFGFLENGIRQTARQFVATQSELEVRGLLTRSEPVNTPYPEDSLDFVECLDLFRFGPYAGVNLEPLTQIVRRATEIRLEPGDVLWEEGEDSTWGIHIVHGIVACTSESRSFRMGPRSVLGLLEANGLVPRGYRAVAETRVVAIKQTTETFLDVLEDNFELALGFLSFMTTMLLSRTLELARARARDEME